MSPPSTEASTATTTTTTPATDKTDTTTDTTDSTVDSSRYEQVDPCEDVNIRLLTKADVDQVKQLIEAGWSEARLRHFKNVVLHPYAALFVAFVTSLLTYLMKKYSVVLSFNIGVGLAVAASCEIVVCTCIAEAMWFINWYRKNRTQDLVDPYLNYRKYGAKFWVAETNDGKIVGALAVEARRGMTTEGEVKRLCVASTHRRSGVASKLLATCTAFCTVYKYKKMFAVCTEFETTCEQFLLKHGWEKTMDINMEAPLLLRVVKAHAYQNILFG